MSKLDIDKIIKDMLSAAAASLRMDFKNLPEEAKNDFKELAQMLVEIEEAKALGNISQIAAENLLRTHTEAVKSRLLSYQVAGKVAVENAVNAALDSIRNAVNLAIGWTLL